PSKAVPIKMISTKCSSYESILTGGLPWELVFICQRARQHRVREQQKSSLPPPEPSTLIVIIFGLIQTTLPPARIILNVIVYFASAPSTSLFMVGILGVLRPGYFCW